jgi:hypothetical protein
MATKVHSALSAAHAHADSAEVANDGGFFVLTTPEQAQDAALELFLHCPTKRQPERALALVAESAATHMGAGLL